MSENKELFVKHFVQGEIVEYRGQLVDEKDTKIYNTINEFKQSLKDWAPNSELMIAVQFSDLIYTENDPDRSLVFITKQNKDLFSKLSNYLKEFIINCGYLINDSPFSSGSYILFGARKLPLSNKILKQI